MAIDSNGETESHALVRRQRELASLYATAKSLTALGELDDVLQSIVRHAHDLMGTDFTYLSLVADGRLSARAAEGTISAAFLTATIPAGVGLGGKVLATRRPQWVRNYAASTLIHHDPGFDRLVVTEDLVALLGVPLVIRGEVVGALFAADRSERSFHAGEIALLSAFADHAAVALDNARLYEESRAALRELRTAYRKIEEHVSVVERAQAIHEALTGVVLEGGTPDDVAQLLADQLGGSVTLLDRAGAVLVRRDSASNPCRIPAELDLGDVVENAHRSGRCTTAAGTGGVAHSVAPVQAGDSYLGALAWSREAATGRGVSDDMDLRTLERATHILGLLILKERAVADASERLSGELLTELMVGSPGISAAQRARTRARGIDADRLNLVLVADSPAVPPTELARHLHDIARDCAGLAGEHLGRATMIVHSADDDHTAEEVHRRLRRALGGPVVVVAERAVHHDWSRAFSLAGRCGAVVRALGHTDLGATTGRYALYAMIFDTDRARELDRFLDRSVGPLVDYDRRRGTDLVGTLSAYYGHRANVAATARALHVHVNTLLKRLDRVSDVLGADWRTENDLELQLGLRLHRLSAVARAS
ncbi:PucR C-terminal helix-turn-helix domain-containing protein [Lentzea xinjiangensis]|uniref:PucR C-terminal helix-turn-helix domain-containing protein n=1 Tax=Lentzea xinjiangensis TaxID=402600 RepID=A0A1H9JQQ0_9PSEU|nr:GAF domain-containing protein [Lentzea xinjiangensis]SEQ89162.1 PucR C-terminal helix-turn-helix domain-containing protein [Lentzea xinjiangensis]